jgi:hypothetical protein
MLRRDPYLGVRVGSKHEEEKPLLSQKKTLCAMGTPFLTLGQALTELVLNFVID